MHADAARCGAGIDGDHVTVFECGNGAVVRRFRASVANAQAARGAGEAAIGQQCHLVAHALAVKQGGNAQHLAHAGAALGAFVADHQHIAGLVLHGLHGVLRFFFRVENPRRALVHQRLEACGLEQSAIRAQITLEHGQPAVWRDRVAGLAHHFTIGFSRMGKFLRQGAAGKGQHIAMQQTLLQQGAHDDASAADVVHITRQEAAAGLEVGNQGRAGKNFGHIIEVKTNACLMRNGGQMQGRIGGATGGTDHGAGVLQRLARHDIARQRGLALGTGPDGFHQLLGGATHQRCAFAENGGHHARTNRRQTQSLADHAHGVGRELTSARTGRGQAGAGDFIEFLHA